MTTSQIQIPLMCAGVTCILENALYRTALSDRLAFNEFKFEWR